MNSSNYNSYSDVFALSEHELRLLLVTGDEPSKVWASWALGMKLNGQEYPSAIKDVLNSEPSPGVRQNLLVFIAGNGDYDLLEAYARTDPSANVRAAACNFIARVSINVQERNLLLDEILISDISIDVRASILSGAARDNRPISYKALGEVISSGNKRLQNIILDNIAARENGMYEDSVMAKEMDGWTKHIHAEVYKKYCTLSYEISGAEYLLQLSSSRLDLSVIPIEILIENEFRTGWFNLDELSQSVSIEEMPIILDLLKMDSNSNTVVWLLKIMALSLLENIQKYDWYESDVCDYASRKLYKILLKPIKPTKTEHAILVLEMFQRKLNDAQNFDPNDAWDEEEKEEKEENIYEIEYCSDFIAKLEPWS